MQMQETNIDNLIKSLTNLRDRKEEREVVKQRFILYIYDYLRKNDEGLENQGQIRLDKDISERLNAESIESIADNIIKNALKIDKSGNYELNINNPRFANYIAIKIIYCIISDVRNEKVRKVSAEYEIPYSGPSNEGGSHRIDETLPASGNQFEEVDNRIDRENLRENLKNKLDTRKKERSNTINEIKKYQQDKQTPETKNLINFLNEVLKDIEKEINDINEGLKGFPELRQKKDELEKIRNFLNDVIRDEDDLVEFDPDLGDVYGKLKRKHDDIVKQIKTIEEELDSGCEIQLGDSGKSSGGESEDQSANLIPSEADDPLDFWRRLNAYPNINDVEVNIGTRIIQNSILLSIDVADPLEFWQKGFDE